jgi:hypothetical protein
MQRDTYAPAVGGRPEQQRDQDDQQHHAWHWTQTRHSKIDQDDHRANWQPIPNDGERPRIAGITHEDQAAA